MSASRHIPLLLVFLSLSFHAIGQPQLDASTAPSPDQPQPPSERLNYGPTQPGESLFAIVTRFRDRDGPYSLRDWAEAIYALNPDDLPRGLDDLRRGSILLIPAESEVGELSDIGRLALAQGTRPDLGAVSAAPAAARGGGRLARRGTSADVDAAEAEVADARPARPDDAADTAPQEIRPTRLARRRADVPETAAAPAPVDGSAVSITGRLAARGSRDETDTAEPALRGGPRRRSRIGLAEGERARRLDGPEPVKAQAIDPNRRSGLARVPRPPVLEAQTPVLVADRWRLVKQLGLIDRPWYDPYNQNPLKGDMPVVGDDWFFQLNLISDTVLEPRRLPTPVGVQTTEDRGSLDVFGGGEQFVFNQNLIAGLVYYRGNTTFKPPDWEFRLTPVFNANYVSVEERRALRIDPARGTTRQGRQIALQEAFVDYHIRNVSDRYDFDSIRFGIQPFSTDFRGFLFQDLQFGLRLFGTRRNNIFQYNLAWFRRLEKDTNSGLNDVTEPLRKDDVLVANLYWQDMPSLGFFSQLTAVYNRNRESEQKNFFNINGFLERPASFGNELPRDYDVLYLGYNGDGHFGRLNLTVAAYLALGEESVGPFNGVESDIRAGFLAAEAGADFDWIRLRVSGLYASGDDDPFDDVSQGFDAIFENPIFAGFDTNYWTRQNPPLIAGGLVTITPRNGMLNSLRTSKEHGQSNFTNPGTLLLGLGADLDLTAELRLSFNVNKLWFEDSAVLEVARNQGSIARDIGWDISTAAIWRPFMSQNIVLRLSGATLLPGQGFKQLFPDEVGYSVLANIVLMY